mmetsp:Transcript_532/g.1623  ORF Transcript_532/g.1623 Transcript_532/m.1623 type:complete len:216 (+) Transcript_532:317-964(+)
MRRRWSGGWRTRPWWMSRQRPAFSASSASSTSLPSSCCWRQAASRRRPTRSASWTVRPERSTRTSSIRPRDSVTSGRSVPPRSTAFGGGSCGARWAVARAGLRGAAASGTHSACTTATGGASGAGDPTGRCRRRSARRASGPRRRARLCRASGSTSTSLTSTRPSSAWRGVRRSASTTSGAWRLPSTTGFWPAPAAPTTLTRRTSSSCRITRPAW